MAWRRLGDKPLSEPMIVNSLTHIRVTRPQWDNQILKKQEYIETQKATWNLQQDARVSFYSNVYNWYGTKDAIWSRVAFMLLITENGVRRTWFYFKRIAVANYFKFHRILLEYLQYLWLPAAHIFIPLTVLSFCNHWFIVPWAKGKHH